MLTVEPSSPAYAGVRFLGDLVGEVDYALWRGGIIPDGPPAYATNAPVHRRELRRQLRTRGMFCAAVPTIVRRIAGLVVPTRGNPLYDGGVAAYFDSVLGPGYFHRSEQLFQLARARSWAIEHRAPVLLGKPYRGVALELQGHAALLLPSGYILQAVFGEGLHWWRTIYQEQAYWNAGGVMVHPRAWLA